jgi:hypothetical protein
LGLRAFGGSVHPYIPHRFGEGYGLSHEALMRVIGGCHPDLIITVDNGISSGNEVQWLLSQGIDVVVTDHHEPGDLVPQGVPVTDPKLEADCYSRELAGAGVALKLVCELGRRRGCPDEWRQYTDLAALGTVSDMMILAGENRSLVADGIERMRHATRPGIVALAAQADGSLLVLEREARIARRYNGSRCWNRLFSFRPETGQKRQIHAWKTRFNVFDTRFANYEGMCFGRPLTDGRQTLLLVADSQGGYGRGPWHLKDRLRLLVLPAPAP